MKAFRRWRAGRPRPAAILLDGRDARRSIGRLAKRANKEPGTGAPLHTKEPVTVASFQTWRGWRENVARNRCLTLHLSKRSVKTGKTADSGAGRVVGAPVVPERRGRSAVWPRHPRKSFIQTRSGSQSGALAGSNGSQSILMQRS